jgi:hypothetical protein
MVRPYHKYVAFDANYTRFIDCRIQNAATIVAVMLRPTFTVLAYGTEGWDVNDRTMKNIGCACRLTRTDCMGAKLFSYRQLIHAVDCHLMDYDYAKLRQEMAPIRDELLRVMMHPSRLRHLPALSLL